MSTIHVSNLIKRYGQVVAVSDVSFEIGPGVTGLLGPNGAGKTTLLKTISGLIKANSGTVRVFGQSLRDNPQLYHRIGYCPESDPFYTYMTGRDFLIANAKLQNMSDPAGAAQRAIETVDLVVQGEKKVRAYSRGMKQRLKVAQSIMHDPELLFLDEPLKGADPTQRKILIDLVVSLGAQGKTVVVSSHILHEVERMASEIILIDRGRLMASGDYREIRNAMADRPHKVSIESSNIHKLAGLLTERALVSGIEMQGEELVVGVSDPNSFYNELPKLALTESIQISKIAATDEDLESVFRYLVR